MTILWSKIQFHCQHHPDSIALIGQDESYTWLELSSNVIDVSQQLKLYKNKVVAIYAENSPAWIIVDLACRHAGITLLPLPSFFSDQQIQYAIKEAGASAVIHHNNDRISSLLTLTKTVIHPLDFVFSTLQKTAALLPNNTGKITFTSGSTGQPKGVCLSNKQQIIVAESVLEATGLEVPKHLSLLPFSVLLENIGGIYTPLLSGGSIVALPRQALGFNGSSGLDVHTLLKTITEYQPNSMIVLAELLTVLVSAVQQGWQAPKSLQFIAVGGSKVSPTLLQQAQTAGLPVYEGYGLSECCSVVSLNSPEQSQSASVGKPLSHVTVDIEDNEIVISDSTFLGYINEPPSWLKPKFYTGDLGFIDDGYLYIKGRKKNLLISSFGRNINPEWVESELLASGLLQQCVVFGDAKPYCIALVQPRNEASTDNDISLLIEQVNQHLPDYAQICHWSRLESPLSFANELMTANGRPKRDKIEQHYQLTIEQHY